MPAARARSSAGAPGLSDATATSSTPSRPWARSISACRLVPAPEARTATFMPRAASGTGRRIERSVAGGEQLRRPARAPRRSAGARTRRSRRRRVVGVLDDDLRAAAAEDLDRPRAADRRPGATRTTSTIARVEILRQPPAGHHARPRSRRQRDERTGTNSGTHVAAGDARRRARAVAEVGQQRRRAGTGTPRRSPTSPGTAPSAPARPRAPSSRQIAAARRSIATGDHPPAARSGGAGAGASTPARARCPITARTASSSDRRPRPAAPARTARTS